VFRLCFDRDQISLYRVQISLYIVQIGLFTVLISSVQISLYIFQISLYSVQISLFSVQISLYSAQISLYSAQISLFSVHISLYSVQIIMCSALISLNSVQRSSAQECSDKVNAALIACPNLVCTPCSLSLSRLGLYNDQYVAKNSFESRTLKQACTLYTAHVLIEYTDLFLNCQISTYTVHCPVSRD
jgi:hypothetical protein